MQKIVGVLGLGYVGFPLAQLLTKRGYSVIGFEIDPEKARGAEKRMGSKKFSATTDFPRLVAADIIVVCVPTPVDHHYIPDYGPLEAACRCISAKMKKGALVIIESTINPGTCEEVVMPIFTKVGWRPGHDFYLAHCPERIDPGNKKWTIETIPRNVGGVDERSAALAAAFYRSFLKGAVLQLSSIKAAEATKIVENTFRDINIAYVNELAMSFDTLGIDLKEVIAGAASKPFAFMPHYPGIGVGGHCIAVDPYYLIEHAGKRGFNHRFLKLAREINNGMPAYTVTLLEEALKKIGKKIGKKIAGTNIGVLGLAYKPNIDDARESPAVAAVKELQRKKAKVHTFDPYIPRESTAQRLEEVLKKCQAIIIATAHAEFRSLSPALCKKYGVKIVIDGRNCLDKTAFEKAGILYKGIGY